MALWRGAGFEDWTVGLSCLRARRAMLSLAMGGRDVIASMAALHGRVVFLWMLKCLCLQRGVDAALFCRGYDRSSLRGPVN